MGDVNGVLQWEDGLPLLHDIAPLSQPLIPPALLSAFNIRPEPPRTSADVALASDNTVSSLRCPPNFNTPVQIQLIVDDASDEHPRNVSSGDSDFAAAMALEVSPEEEGDEKAAKRARLVWTPQLHRRFVDVVAHLGIKNAVLKTIMQLMNVEGLTRENVASHWQKYRLYLKRNQGINPESAPQANSSSPEVVEVPKMKNYNLAYSRHN